MNKICLVQDDSSHWYAIPTNLKKEFEIWSDQEDDEDLSSIDFEEYGLGCHLSCYCFENFELIQE
jgi:hypothetical protein